MKMANENTPRTARTLCSMSSFGKHLLQLMIHLELWCYIRSSKSTSRLARLLWRTWITKTTGHLRYNHIAQIRSQAWTCCSIFKQLQLTKWLNMLQYFVEDGLRYCHRMSFRVMYLSWSWACELVSFTNRESCFAAWVPLQLGSPVSNWIGFNSCSHKPS